MVRKVEMGCMVPTQTEVEEGLAGLFLSVPKTFPALAACLPQEWLGGLRRVRPITNI